MFGAYGMCAPSIVAVPYLGKPRNRTVCAKQTGLRKQTIAVQNTRNIANSD